ncbi:unnamed protein product [Bursaphelenchus xylophilus]|uniref:(pine wood nematode) hypothetical protein n=1 Tax=Bursaphelenchus xylophilus TaxID=6326 RepID=A0A1I7RXC6_BURXY|nr:unnamed protein product [Bursaphelenchus xylophilus]CAG9126269.1 unnamed protein product [Bursaphelenchus xylophilus]
MEDTMARTDIGPHASFGGGGDRHTPRTPTPHRPVILVHGITNTASTFARVREYFNTHGYRDYEVYGTTYGDGGKTNVVFFAMDCHHMKIIRSFIQVVADYTSSKVDVIGYSMGSPVARKAIMGGKCVDTGEDLGGPLTHLVHTFIGAAGANYGSFLCLLPFGSCNLINGLACGSRFLNDINSKQRYEGEKIFTIYSTGDEKVGYRACGRFASDIQGQDKAFVKQGMNHDQVMLDTANLQLNLLTQGHE